MKIISICFLILSCSGHAKGYDRVLFKKLADQNEIPTAHDGSCLKTRKEVTRQLYNTPIEITPYEGVKEHIDCLSLLKNFKHDRKFQRITPSWDEIFKAKDSGPKVIKGRMSYMGFIPQKYNYDIQKNNDGGYDVSVRIFVKRWQLWKDSSLMKHSLEVREKHQKRVFDLLLEEVSSFWTNKDHNLNFNFKRVEDRKDAHFSIRVVQSLAPLKYNSKWTWMINSYVDSSDEELKNTFDFESSFSTYTHEVGHMLGLEDEYNLPKATLGMVAGYFEQFLNPDRSKIDLKTDKWVRGCDQTSVMCKDPGSLMHINNYHYYLVLRRYLK